MTDSSGGLPVYTGDAAHYSGAETRHGIAGPRDAQIQKYIRTPQHTLPRESGMLARAAPVRPARTTPVNEGDVFDMHAQYLHHARQRNTEAMVEPWGAGLAHEPDHGHGPATGLRCLDVAAHARACPVCARYFASDKTPYMIIVGLCGVIIMLYRRLRAVTATVRGE